MTEAEAISVAQRFARWRGCEFGNRVTAALVTNDFPAENKDFRERFVGDWFVCLEPPQPCLGGKWFFVVDAAGRVVWTNAPPFWAVLLLPLQWWKRRKDC